MNDIYEAKIGTIKRIRDNSIQEIKDLLFIERSEISCDEVKNWIRDNTEEFLSLCRVVNVYENCSPPKVVADADAIPFVKKRRESYEERKEESINKMREITNTLTMNCDICINALSSISYYSLDTNSTHPNQHRVDVKSIQTAGKIVEDYAGACKKTIEGLS